MLRRLNSEGRFLWIAFRVVPTGSIFLYIARLSCCPAWNVPNLFELRIFFKRHRCSEAVLPKVWSKDHFHQMLTPFQINRIRISMEWGPRIYSFNKHKRLFWSTVNSETYCFNCIDPTKGESDSAILFSHATWLKAAAEMGIWVVGGTWSSLDHSARGIQHVSVEGHCLDAAGQWEYHIPGVEKSAKKQSANLEGVGMHPEQCTMSYLWGHWPLRINMRT